MKVFSKILAVLGIAQLQVDAEGTYLMNEHLEAIEAQLETDATTIAGHASALAAANTATQTAEAAVTKLTADLATANTALTAANGKVTEHEATITSLTAERDALQVKLSGKPVRKPGGTGPDGGANAEDNDMPSLSWAKQQIGE